MSSHRKHAHLSKNTIHSRPVNIKKDRISRSKIISAIEKKHDEITQSLTKIFAYSLFLVFATVIVYSNTLRNGYVMDDIEVLQQNSFVTNGIRSIPALLITPHLKGFMVTPNETYRPLSLVMFAIEYQFFGPNPAVNHFFNIFVFAGCVVLLFLFLIKIFDEGKIVIAFLAALLFAVHPIHTEVVANIKSRDELLSYFFGFFALDIFIKYYIFGKPHQFLLGILSLFLAFLSKETVISFIGIVPLIFFFYKNENKRRSLQITSGTIAVAAVFIALRVIILRLNDNQYVPVNTIDNFLANAPGFGTRMATSILVLGKYLWLLFIPYPLICDYSVNSIPYVHFNNIVVLLSGAVYIFLIIFAFNQLFKYKKNLWAFGILFYLICLALFTNIPFLIGSGMNERFLFFASTGFCILMALAFEKWIFQKNEGSPRLFQNPKAWLVLIPVLFVFSKITIARNAEWKDNYTLYSADLKKSPKNSRLNYCVGYELVSKKSEFSILNCKPEQEVLKEGIDLLKKSLSIQPGNVNAQIELGNAYFLNKQIDSAMAYDLKALAKSPDDPVILNNLAGIYFVNRDYKLAIQFCKHAIALNRDYANAINDMGLCYYNLQQYDSAIYFFKRAIGKDPNFIESYKLIANAYQFLGNADSTRKYRSITVVRK